MRNPHYRDVDVHHQLHLADGEAAPLDLQFMSEVASTFRKGLAAAGRGAEGQPSSQGTLVPRHSSRTAPTRAMNTAGRSQTKQSHM